MSSAAILAAELAVLRAADGELWKAFLLTPAQHGVATEVARGPMTLELSLMLELTS
jgi:hypothetical protein